MCWTSIIQFRDENPKEYRAALEKVVIKKGCVALTGYGFSGALRGL